MLVESLPLSELLVAANDRMGVHVVDFEGMVGQLVECFTNEVTFRTIQSDVLFDQIILFS